MGLSPHSRAGLAVLALRYMTFSKLHGINTAAGAVEHGPDVAETHAGAANASATATVTEMGPSTF